MKLANEHIEQSDWTGHKSQLKSLRSLNAPFFGHLDVDQVQLSSSMGTTDIKSTIWKCFKNLIVRIETFFPSEFLKICVFLMEWSSCLLLLTCYPTFFRLLLRISKCRLKDEITICVNVPGQQFGRLNKSFWMKSASGDDSLYITSNQNEHNTQHSTFQI